MTAPIGEGAKRADREIFADLVKAANKQEGLAAVLTGAEGRFDCKEKAAAYLYGAIAVLRRSAEAEESGKEWNPVGMREAGK